MRARAARLKSAPPTPPTWAATWPIVISPSTKPGTRSGTLFNHYSLVGTAEQLLGLPKLGLASSFPTLTKAFHL
jgi:hypothetical protein